MDPSDFISNAMKDTMGQLTGAGQSVGKGVDSARETAAAREEAQNKANQEETTTPAGETPATTIH